MSVRLYLSSSACSAAPPEGCTLFAACPALRPVEEIRERAGVELRLDRKQVIVTTGGAAEHVEGGACRASRPSARRRATALLQVQ